MQLWAGISHHVLAGMAFVAGFTVWWFLVSRATQDRFRPQVIFGAIFVAIVIALVFAPATSKDINSYAMYGRMMANYGASPYLHAPVDFAFDPWFTRISLHWSDAPSLYGPVFSAISAAVIHITGTSFFATRLAFQLLAAGAFVAILLIIWRLCHSARAICFIGLNPLVLTLGVNDAHADMLVGLFVLIAVALLYRSANGMINILRLCAVGICLAIAAMIKVVAVLALVGLIGWMLIHVWQKDIEVRTAVSQLVPIVCGFAITVFACAFATGGADMLLPLAAASGRHTRFSFWHPLFLMLRNAVSEDLLARSISMLANATIVVVSGFVIWRSRKNASPIVAIAAPLVAYQVFGAYVLAWYAMWSLPVLVLAYVSRQTEERTNIISLLLIACAVHASWVATAYFNGYIAIVIAVAIMVFGMQRLRSFSWRARERF